MPHVAETKPEQVQADIAAAAAHLRGLGCGSIFTVGFCFGGRNSWLAAASGHGLQGAVGFYGYPTERNGVLGAAERASEIEAPILALQAGDDKNITKVENDAFEAALTEAGVDHEIVVYAGAPHSFFDRGTRRVRQPPPKTPGPAPSPSSSAWPSFPAGGFSDKAGARHRDVTVTRIAA